MIEVLHGLTPADIGLDQYQEFQAEQLEAIEKAVYGEKRFQGLALPMGAGKSLVAVAVQKLTGMRTVILTSTKGLQDQYARDFKRNGLVDIRGKANYECQADLTMSCRDGQRAACSLYSPRGNSDCLY